MKSSLFRFHDDFEALIRIYRTDEGGRKLPPNNGIRWDFCYAGDSIDNLYMIFPDFYDKSGSSLPQDKPLPIDTELPARMLILNDEFRVRIHRDRIKVGLRFFCHEGPKAVATGYVTRITGLHHDRAPFASLP
jgi:hypothetical protein